MIRIMVPAVFALAFLATSPAASQPDSPSPSAPAHSAKDPNQKICEEEIPLGTRLNVHRVCQTRSEWERRRLEDREAIEKQQVQFPKCAGPGQC